jgi:hypothetical protein
MKATVSIPTTVSITTTPTNIEVCQTRNRKASWGEESPHRDQTKETSLAALQLRSLCTVDPIVSWVDYALGDSFLAASGD